MTYSYTTLWDVTLSPDPLPLTPLPGTLLSEKPWAHGPRDRATREVTELPLDRYWPLAAVRGGRLHGAVHIWDAVACHKLGSSPFTKSAGSAGLRRLLGNLALAIPLSWWTSRCPAKMLTTVTLVLGILLLFLQSWAPAFVYLLVGRLGFGITLLARIPARSLLTKQWFPQREIVLVNSLGNAMFGLVVGGGLIATPFILSNLGDNWRTTLRVFGLLLIVLTVLWVALGKDRDTPEDRTRVDQSGPVL